MTRILILASLFISLFSYANDDISQCRSIANSGLRLACYDKLFSQHNVDNTAQKKVNVSETQNNIVKQKIAQNLKPVASELTKTFGEENLKLKENTKLENITDVVAKVTKNLHGDLSISLKNKQIWKENGSSHILKLHVGDRVTIKRGVFNSFLLNKQGSNRTIRVKRVK
jgi:hypothetical protein